MDLSRARNALAAMVLALTGVLLIAAGFFAAIIVRGNPGGLLVETAQTADLFLDSGDVLVQVDRDRNEQVFDAQRGTVTEIPIAIVQDEFSASGSELLAAALQENDRALVVGARSFGTALAVALHPLDTASGQLVVGVRVFAMTSANGIPASSATLPASSASSPPAGGSGHQGSLRTRDARDRRPEVRPW